MKSVGKTLLQIKDTIKNKPSKVSFEFFPPKTVEAVEKIKESVSALEPLSPCFLSVTCGAGGATRELTYDLVKYIKQETSINPAPHLTCVNATKEEVNAIAMNYMDIGINNIVALRGDMPGMNGHYKPHPRGYAYADDLVAGLMELGDFDISVAAYPESHPQAPSPDFDLEHLKRKIDAGAKRAITQYCFDTDDLLRFIEKAHAKGITAPIVPGIITMTGFSQLVSFSKRCGSSVPDWMLKLFDNADEYPLTRDMLAVAVAAEQCRLLMQEGIKEFHFYTLNRIDIAQAICRILGVY